MEIRVAPEATFPLMDYIEENKLNATWPKDNHGLYTIFSAADEATMKLLETFVKECKAECMSDEDLEQAVQLENQSDQ